MLITALLAACGGESSSPSDGYPPGTVRLGWRLYSVNQDSASYVTAKTDGSERRVLYAVPTNVDLSQAVSRPHFGSIVLHETRNSPTGIWLSLDAATGAVDTLPFPTDLIGPPAYRPDGQAIAWRVQPTDSQDNFLGVITVVTDANGGARRTVLPVPSDGGACTGVPRWSPDGTRLAIQCGSSDGLRLRVIAADGSGSRLLDGPAQIGSFLDGTYPSFTWSPDSREVVYACGYAGVCAVDADGGAARVITTTPASGVTWGAGPRLAFWSGYPLPVSPNLYTVLGDGSGQLALPIIQFNPSWSPDGSRLAFTRANNMGLVTMRADGTDQVVIDVPGSRSPMWLTW